MSSPSTSSPALRIALWGLVLAFLAWWQGPGFVRDLRPATGHLNDFFQDWASARFHLDGIPVYGNQEEAVRRYLDLTVKREKGDLFLEKNAHPPTSILLFLPFAFLDYYTACLVWNLLSLATLPLSFWLICRQLRFTIPAWVVIPLTALFLVCGPLREQNAYGQFNLVLLLLLAGGWAAERSGHPLLGGALLGVATALKLFPGILFLPYLLRGHWRVLIGGAIAGAALTGLALAVLGVTAFEDYIQDVMPYVAGLRDSWLNASLPGFFTKLFDRLRGGTTPLLHSPMLAKALTIASTLLVLVMLTAISLRARSRTAFDYAFSTTLVAMLLVSPVTWPHYFLLLLLPALLLWRDLPADGWSRPVFYAGLVCLWISPLWYWKPMVGATAQTWHRMRAEPWQTLTALSFITYGLIALFVVSVWAAWRARDNGDGADSRPKATASME